MGGRLRRLCSEGKHLENQDLQELQGEEGLQAALFCGGHFRRCPSRRQGARLHLLLRLGRVPSGPPHRRDPQARVLERERDPRGDRVRAVVLHPQVRPRHRRPLLRLRRPHPRGRRGQRVRPCPRDQRPGADGAVGGGLLHLHDQHRPRQLLRRRRSHHPLPPRPQDVPLGLPRLRESPLPHRQGVQHRELPAAPVGARVQNSRRAPRLRGRRQDPPVGAAVGVQQDRALPRVAGPQGAGAARRHRPRLQVRDRRPARAS
mmetsp:Transcript_24142/g.41517  ORF Transcript_24142/g.41517 Transcript_24142/m.41517 type:complete len:260 (-) Transcript_24142:1148-1927(-)